MSCGSSRSGRERKIIQINNGGKLPKFNERHEYSLVPLNNVLLNDELYDSGLVRL
jgi:hypothetical protein